MNIELVYFVLFCVSALTFIFGVMLGFRLHVKSDTVGNLMVVPNDEDEQPYMFLDLVMTPDDLEENDYVVLHIKKVETRENHRV